MTECDYCKKRRHALGMRMCRACWSQIGIEVMALGLKIRPDNINRVPVWYYDAMKIGPGSNYAPYA